MNNFIKNLTKLNFNMEEIKLFDSFAGIGALHQALKELGIPIKLVGMSEVDVNAIISYSGVHKLDLNKITPLEDKEMRKYLMDRNIGWSFEENKSKIPRMKKDMVEKCYKACVLTNNYGDISKLDYDNLPNFDLFNFSFPCQSVSSAGKQEGFIKEDGTITRSGLYKYGIEVIKAKKPKYIMIENVKGLITKKFINGFYSIVNEIDSVGYNCYYPKKKDGKPTCLNAKNYGIPQNRERIFVICIRKDVDKNNFFFPKGFDNGIRLKHLLEDNVNEKYFLSEEIQNRFKPNNNKDIDKQEINVMGTSAPEYRTIGQRDITYGVNGVMSTLAATDYKQPKQIIDEKYYLKENTQNFFIENSLNMEAKGNGFRFEPHIKNNAEISKAITTRAGARMDDNYILDIDSEEKTLKFDSNNLNFIGGVGDKDLVKDGQRQPKIIEEFPCIAASRGRNPDNPSSRLSGLPTEQRLEINQNGTSNALTTVQKDNYVLEQTNNIQVIGNYSPSNHDASRIVDSSYISPTVKENHGTVTATNIRDFRIRKLTPKECWRLMGFRDEHIERAIALGISDSQLYKQAGNSIVVDVLYYIFKELFKEYIVE